MEKELQLQIAGMHCGACVRRVTAALSALPGAKVEAVEVGSAKVKIDDASTAPNDVLEAIQKIGFTATL